MRAKLVNENINFERGQDPFKTMDIGKNRKDENVLTDEDIEKIIKSNVSRTKIWDILNSQYTFNAKYKFAMKKGILTIHNFQGTKTLTRKYFANVPVMINNIIIGYIKGL